MNYKKIVHEDGKVEYWFNLAGSPGVIDDINKRLNLIEQILFPEEE